MDLSLTCQQWFNDQWE